MHFIDVPKSPLYWRWRPCCLIVYAMAEIHAVQEVKVRQELCSWSRVFQAVSAWGPERRIMHALGPNFPNYYIATATKYWLASRHACMITFFSASSTTPPSPLIAKQISRCQVPEQMMSCLHLYHPSKGQWKHYLISIHLGYWFQMAEDFPVSRDLLIMLLRAAWRGKRPLM